jgi:hypothetical protein
LRKRDERKVKREREGSEELLVAAGFDSSAIQA